MTADRFCDATPGAPSRIVEVKARPLHKRERELCRCGHQFGAHMTPGTECVARAFHRSGFCTCDRFCPVPGRPAPTDARWGALLWLELELERVREVRMDP